jgi:hypothetical protein
MRPAVSLTLCLLVGAAVLAVCNQPRLKSRAVSLDRTAIEATSRKAQMIFTPAQTPGQAPMMADAVVFADELNAAMGAAFDAGLIVPAQSSEESRDQGRAGLDDLSHEMCTCAAYFSLLSTIMERSAGSAANAAAAKRIKSNAQAMLSQGINVANFIGVDEKVATARVQVALKKMVETINGDPGNSLQAMHTKYGLPCDALLQQAPQRFIALLKQYQAD